jgi:peptidoglycan/xylan/chitin deacetylase (PgdA/CDA1 family)
MSQKDLKELLNNGMEIGSHSLTHPNLRRVAPSQLISEIKDSKIILEENFDCQIEVFAYPYGIFDSKIVEIVGQSGYKAARTTLEGFDQNPKNMYTLKAIQVYDNLDQLKRIFPLRK